MLDNSMANFVKPMKGKSCEVQVDVQGDSVFVKATCNSARLQVNSTVTWKYDRQTGDLLDYKVDLSRSYTNSGKVTAKQGQVDAWVKSAGFFSHEAKLMGLLYEQYKGSGVTRANLCSAFNALRPHWKRVSTGVALARSAGAPLAASLRLLLNPELRSNPEAVKARLECYDPFEEDDVVLDDVAMPTFLSVELTLSQNLAAFYGWWESDEALASAICRGCLEPEHQTEEAHRRALWLVTNWPRLYKSVGGKWEFPVSSFLKVPHDPTWMTPGIMGRIHAGILSSYTLVSLPDVPGVDHALVDMVVAQLKRAVMWSRTRGTGHLRRRLSWSAAPAYEVVEATRHVLGHVNVAARLRKSLLTQALSCTGPAMAARTKAEALWLIRRGYVVADVISAPEKDSDTREMLRVVLRHLPADLREQFARHSRKFRANALPDWLGILEELPKVADEHGIPEGAFKEWLQHGNPHAYGVMRVVKKGGLLTAIALGTPSYLMLDLLDATQQVVATTWAEALENVARLKAAVAQHEKDTASSLMLGSEGYVAKVALILRAAADGLVKHVQDTGAKHVTVLGRDAWPLIPLAGPKLVELGVGLSYFVLSRTQFGDKSTRRAWKREIPKGTLAIDTGYAGSVIDEIKCVDPTVKGALLSSTGKYPQIETEISRTDVVSTIERMPKLIGRGLGYDADGMLLTKDEHEGERGWAGGPEAFLDELVEELGIDAKWAQFTGVSREERSLVGWIEGYQVPIVHEDE